MRNLGEDLVAQGNYSFHGNALAMARQEHARRLMAAALTASGPSLPLNIEPIDAHLPGQGLETALHEIAPADYRSGPAAWGFLLALAKSVAGKRSGPIFWPLARSEYDFGLPYGPGLKSFGFNTGDFLFARCASRVDSLWAMEEALRTGGFAAIIGARARKMDLTMSRRLQLAAEETHTPIFLLRRTNDGALSAARTRWRITPLRAARDRFGLMRHARWHVALERARGGKPVNGYWSGIMTRYACVFLPYWPIERLLRKKRRKAPEDRKGQGRPCALPFALIASQAGGFRLTAVNAQGAHLGLTPGELLTDARARVPALITSDAEPNKDRQALIKLARWCGRFSPHIAHWPEEERTQTLHGSTLHGLSLDITGCAHLFGGEEGLADSILSAFDALGITARLSLAETIGAAHALVCYGKEKRLSVPPGKEADAIKNLPVAALRLNNKNAAGLSRVGLKRIRDIIPLPRANLTKRFGPEIIWRLEQALGKAPEPLSPLLAHAPYRANAVLAEPICSEDHVLTLIKKLCNDIAPILNRDGKGARALLLTLFRVDGELAELKLGLAEATSDPSHIAKLFSLTLSRLAQDYDAGFGYEAARLDVLEVEKITSEQSDIGSNKKARETNLHHFIDRLGSRLGVENILRLHPQESHIPERAVVTRPAAYHRDAQWEETPSLPRPLMMLPCAEPADVMALLPEGPPRQFRWRKVLYTIADAEGPERMRPEWWREKNTAARERDYYIVEDEEGRRFWLYREGLYDAHLPPRWFVHGVFT